MTSSSPQSHELTSEQSHTALAIAVTSGKGGVGKTNITTNLGIALAKNGHKVCIFDADTSLANINILLGIAPEYTLEQFLSGEKSINDIMLTGPEGVKIVPAASGIAEFSEFTDAQQLRIVEALQLLEKQFDYILIDTAAGISENVIRFLQSAQYAVVVISPEPTSLTDAFSLVKVLQRRHYDKPIYTLVNMAKNYKHSMDVFKRFSHAINKYVHLKVRYLGYIPMDQAMRNAVATQSPVIISSPHSPAARCITLLAQILLKHFKPEEAPEHSISEFWYSKTTPAQKIASLTETTDPLMEVTKDAAEVISHQQSKEAGRIFALTKDALANQEFTQSQSEDLLAHAVENYLIQFGTLPQQAIDLLLQAHAQNQLPPEVTEQLAQQLPENPANDESSVDDTPTQHVESIQANQPSTITTPATPQDNPAADQTSTPTGTLQSQIDKLVYDAELTKKELIEASINLRKHYRSLYNTELLQVRAVPATAGSTNNQAHQSADNQKALVQSIRFASAVDQRGDF